MDVKLPNGTVVTDVPEGTSQKEVARRAIASGLAKAEDFQGLDLGEQGERGFFGGVTDGLGSQIAEAPGIIGRGLGQAVLDEVGRETTLEDVADSARTIIPGYGTGAAKFSPGVGISRTARNLVGLARSGLTPDSVRGAARDASESLRSADEEARARVEQATPDDLGIVAQGLRSGAQSLVEMAPGTILSAITRNPSFMVANIAGTSAGRSYADARAEGLDVQDAQDSAAVQTGIEILTEYLPAKAFTDIFGAAPDRAGGEVLRFLREEMVGEQAATLLQSLSDLAYGMDEELESAIDQGDAAAVSKIVFERAAITAVATAAAGGSQIAIGKAATRVAGARDPQRELAREMNRQVDAGGNLRAATSSFDEARVSDELEARRVPEGRRLPDPNPNGADFVAGEEGVARRQDGYSRASDAPVIRRGVRGIREDEAPVVPEIIEDRNRGRANYIIDPEGRAVRPWDVRQLDEERARAKAVRRSPERARLTAPERRERLDRPERAGALPAPSPRPETFREPEWPPLDLRGPAQQAPATPETDSAPQPASPAAEAAQAPAPKMIRAKKASERFGVDKGGTVVSDGLGNEALLWKDDGTRMWNISFPKETGLPDINSRGDTRPELISEIQRDLPRMLELARDPSGRPVATPEQVASLRREPAAVDPAAQDATPPAEDAPVDLGPNEAALDEDLDANNEAPAGPPRRVPQPEDVPRRESEADVSIPVGVKAADELAGLSQTIERNIVWGEGQMATIEMSVEDAELAIAELEDSPGGRRALSAIESIERRLNDIGLQGAPYMPPSSVPAPDQVSGTASADAAGIVESAKEGPGPERSASILDQLRAAPASRVSADEQLAIGRAMDQLYGAGFPTSWRDSVNHFMLISTQDGTPAAFWEGASNTLGINKAVLQAAEAGDTSLLAGAIAHEYGHGLDRELAALRGTNSRGDSMSSPAMALELSVNGLPMTRGEAMADAMDAYYQGSDVMRRFLSYPFDSIIPALSAGADPVVVQGMVQREVFAQGHALYYIDREMLRAEAPALFRHVEEAVNEQQRARAGAAQQPGDAGGAPVSGGVRGTDPLGAVPDGSREGDRADRGSDPDGQAPAGAEQAGADRQRGDPAGPLSLDLADFGLKKEFLVGSRGKVDKRKAVVNKAHPGNIDSVRDALDRVARNHPDPLESEAAWLRMEREVTGSNRVPRPPYRAIELARDVPAWAQEMRRMTPAQVQGAARGFEGLERMKRIYAQGAATPGITARVMLWGILSRRASAYPHESAYLDLATGDALNDLIDAALSRELTDADVARWKEFVQSIPEGSPGRSAISNANAFGETLLRKMSQRVDGVSGLERFHNLISSPDVSTADVRREFYALAPDSGIRNKVISFAMLMTGRTDAMIMDRIQINTMMDWPRYGRLIYDDVAKVYDGAQGLARYEALERSIGSRVGQLYDLIGRPGDASVGRYHWESWVLNSSQVVAHPTFDAIARSAMGDTNFSDIVAPEGRYTKFAYGASYGRDGDGRPFFVYSTTDGQPHRFTVDGFREMLAEVKRPARGVIPSKFRLDDYAGKGYPWFEADGVNKEKLNELVRQYGTPEQDGRAGAAPADSVRPAADGAGRTELDLLDPPDERRSGRDDGAAGRDRRGADQGVRVPRYGTPREGAASIRGRHYSRQRRESLSGSFYGQGLQGEARRQAVGAPAPARAPDAKAEIELGSKVSEAKPLMPQIKEIDPEAVIKWGSILTREQHREEIESILENGGVDLDRIDAPIKPGSYRDALRENGLMTEPGPSNNRFTLDDEVRSAGWTGKMLSSKWWVRKVQDKLVRLKDTQKVISETLGITELPDEVNTYRKEELFHGKVADDLQDLEERHVKRLAEVMARRGVTHGELDLFLYARHAQERNRFIREERDPSNRSGSGMTDEEARMILQKARDEGKFQALSDSAQVVYNMLEENRTRMQESGLLDEEAVGGWREQFQYYVPLKGFAALDAEPINRVGRGFSIGGKETLAAAGRRTLADSPLAFAFHDVSNKIIRARRNEIAVSFLNMVEKYPDPKMWRVYDPSKKGMAPKEKVDFDRAERIDEPGTPRFFAAKRDGKTYYIEIKDQLLNRAMHNAGVEQVDGIARILINTTGAATRFLSSMNTTLNPEFFIVNAARDVQAALFNMLAEQQIQDGKAKGKKIAQDMIEDALPAWRAFARGLRGKQGTTQKQREMDQYYREFREDGAMTGWAMQMTAEQQQQRLERLARHAGGGTIAGAEKAFEGALKFVEEANLSVENAIRLSAYANARKQGLTRDQAASLAKNLTVNFNRRGEISTVANSLYMFFNAAIQGNAQIIRSLANDPRKIGGLTIAQKAAAGMVGVGIATTLYNAAFSAIDDDDESFYDKIPDYVKQRNIVLMSPYGENYVKIPLPYGYNIFHVAGVAAAEAFDGSRSPGDAALMTMLSAFDAFSPLGLAETDDLGVGATKLVSPTVTLPVVELIANENHFGSPIMRENFPTGTQLPDSSLSMRNTATWAKELSRFLNRATGGEEHVDGAIDVSPDAFEHLMEFAFGGLGRFTLRSWNYGEKALRGEEVEAREIPFIRQLYGEPSKFENMGLYYDRRHDIEQAIAERESRRGKERLEWTREHRDMLRLAPVIESTESSLREIRKRRRKLESQPASDARQKMIDRLVEAEYRQYDRLNRAWNRAMEKD